MLARREGDDGGARMLGEERRLPHATCFVRAHQFQEVGGGADHHHGMTVQDEVLGRLSWREVLAGHAQHLDRHAANVLLFIAVGRGVRKADSCGVRVRPGEQADAQIGRQVRGDDELGVDASRGPALVETRHGPGRMVLLARRFQEADELGGDETFVRQNGFLSQIIDRS